MLKLRDRQKQIPYGMRFTQPQTGWTAPPYASFDTIVDGLMAHRQANPFLAQKFNWRTDRRGVEAEVEDYNAQICKAMGWTAYIVTDEAAPPPPPKASGLRSWGQKLQAAAEAVTKVSAGAGVLVDWLGEGATPVQNSLAESRATTCSGCPLNQQGDWTRFFTQPVSEQIKKQLEIRASLQLTTSRDQTLNVCSACLCPLKLKVHVPIGYITKRLPESVYPDLHQENPRCWILQETGK